LAGSLLVPLPALAAGRGAIPALLHDGRFAAAREALGPVTAESSPEDAFLQAFVTYWTLIFDDENDALEKRLDAEIATALSAAERREDDPAASLWSGNAHLVLAQLRAGQKRSLGAAFEAKKAKKQLEAAVASGVRPEDALFGLGTYNYMADTLPSYIKGLRALLFLPKGDRAILIRMANQAIAANAGAAEAPADPDAPAFAGRGRGGAGFVSRVTKNAGMNRFVWDLRHTPSGLTAPPGTYKVTLTVGGATFTQPLNVLIDLNTPGDYEALLRRESK
jgi:hypothetical protein